MDPSWIRDRLWQERKSQKDLAKALGMDASGISRLLDGKRRLRADEVEKIRNFFDGASGRPEPANLQQPEGKQADTLTRAVQKRRSKVGLEEIDVVGTFDWEKACTFRLDPTNLERRPRPSQLQHVYGAYAGYVQSDMLAPRYKRGEVIYVHPSKPPVVGRSVIGQSARDKRIYFIGEMLHANEDAVVLALPRYTISERERQDQQEISRREIVHLGQIVFTAFE